MKSNTIVAIATAPGKGGIGIIRLSGEEAFKIACKITNRDQFRERLAYFVDFYDQKNQAIDHGIILAFKAPNSYTGEDVVELQGHGSPIILNMLLKTALFYGARLSEPGEFTKRAFLNGKLDLSQAEAVIDLIHASSEMAARCALKSLKGEFSKCMSNLSEELFDLIVDVEACIDFTEDEVPELFKSHLQERLNNLSVKIEDVLKAGCGGQVLRNGIQIALIGTTNVGKSTLLNCLAQKNKVLTTNIPGTTRDIISIEIEIEGVPFKISDTAGLRESDDLVENMGIEKTLELLPEVDHILLLIDVNDKKEIPLNLKKRIPQLIPVTYVFNKIDISPLNYLNSKDKLYISAQCGTGIEDLKKHLLHTCFPQQHETLFLARQRHIESIHQAKEHIELAIVEAKRPHGALFEIIAEKLHLARNAIRTILGENADQDILGRIFSKFCIGK